MRQAGRYLPEYRALREKAGSFLDLCFNPDLASEVTLQPIDRFDFDAAILFADILLIPHALGQPLRFEEGAGPILEPVKDQAGLDTLRSNGVADRLDPVFETVRKTRSQLAPDKALIGFAGAPWTVATYMLAGGSVRDPAGLRAQVYENPDFVRDLIELLTDQTIAYLIAQIEAGADAVQLFDSWAGGLPWPVLDRVSLRPLEKICSALKKAKPETPIILFPKGVGEKAVEYVQIKGCDAVGIDYAMDPSWARANLSPFGAVQGGLDPMLLVVGGEALLKSAETYLRLFHDVPYIFNLGHGITPETPISHVEAVIKRVREAV